MFDHVGKWLEKKAKANFKIHDVINCETNKYKIHIHCVQSIRIRSYSGPHFPAFELNTDSYSVSLCIQSEFGKMRTRITPNTETFHAVSVCYILLHLPTLDIDRFLKTANIIKCVCENCPFKDTLKAFVDFKKKQKSV